MARFLEPKPRTLNPQQDEANQVDMAPFPLDRHIWTDFPAIPNFNAEGEEEVKAKGGASKQAKK